MNPDTHRDNDIKDFYLSDEYIRRNPTLGVEDSEWKAARIYPAADLLLKHLDKDELRLLDIGGGAGVVLDLLSSYIHGNSNAKVIKYMLDLSPGMLEIQQKRNPDVNKILNENICETSLADKEVDCALLV